MLQAAPLSAVKWAALTGTLSAVTALSMPRNTPMWAGGAPGMVYFLMFFTGLASRLSESRMQRKLRDAHSGGQVAS